MRMTIFITDGVNTCKHFVFSVFYTDRNGIFSFSGQFFLPFQIFFLFLAHSLPAPFADTKVKIFYLKVSQVCLHFLHY